jgi:hypothetical protein
MNRGQSIISVRSNDASIIMTVRAEQISGGERNGLFYWLELVFFPTSPLTQCVIIKVILFPGL